jgi:hypothetical protein
MIRIGMKSGGLYHPEDARASRKGWRISESGGKLQQPMMAVILRKLSDFKALSDDAG